jgi:hypothetical protein
VQRLTPNDVPKLAPGRAHYSAFLTEDGTFVDDLLVYRLARTSSCSSSTPQRRGKDFAWAQPRSPVRTSCSRTSPTAGRCSRCRARRRSRSCARSRRSRSPRSAVLRLRQGRGRRTRGDRLAHRLHRRGRLRALRRARGRAGAVGPPARRPAARTGWCPPGSARATRCGSRRGWRSTATRSTARRRPGRPASTGSSSSTRGTSSAATRSSRRARGPGAAPRRLRGRGPRHRARGARGARRRPRGRQGDERHLEPDASNARSAWRYVETALRGRAPRSRSTCAAAPWRRASCRCPFYKRAR